MTKIVIIGLFKSLELCRYSVDCRVWVFHMALNLAISCISGVKRVLVFSVRALRREESAPHPRLVSYE